MRVRDLLVEIVHWGIRVPEQALLEPLRQVRAGRFEVVLPWPSGLEMTGEFGDAGFVVTRPPASVHLLELNVDKGNPGVGKGRGVWWWLRRRG